MFGGYLDWFGQGLVHSLSSNGFWWFANADTDLLIIGMGENMFPLSPETKRHISLLGIRVEILSTRNAASQFNMLATERGVTEIAAAMIPCGWKGR